MEQISDIALITRTFYEEHAPSFSATRQDGWEGWKRLVSHLSEPCLSVADIACGNLRFERFLADAGFTGQAFGVDGCSALLAEPAPEGFTLERTESDLIGMLAEEGSLAGLPIPPCSLCVCFGFMHHVPTAHLREALLDSLLTLTQPGGLCAVSFWRFSLDERLASKAECTTKRAQERFGIALEEPGDAFLGWQADEDAFRFCHSFSDDEIDHLRDRAEAQGALVVDDFCADGKTGNLNRYLLFQRA